MIYKNVVATMFWAVFWH